MGKTSHRLAVTTMASGFELALTRLEIQGAEDGPRVGVSAMIHGDELDGLLILRRLWSEVDPAKLRGTLVLLPVANPLAMEANSRNTPIDMLDMNRLFPGARDGWLSEQIAHVICSQFIDGLDFLIDIHAGGPFPWVDYCYVGNDLGLSRAFQSGLLYQPAQWYPGTGAGYAQSRSIPTVVVEIGGGFRDQDVHIANGLRGIDNCLRYAGSVAGQVASRHQVLMREMKVMRPTHGGLCVPRAALTPGAVVAGGTPLADIVSPYTFETLETMTAPFERSIVVLTRNYITRIHPGDYGFMMGNEATSSQLA